MLELVKIPIKAVKNSAEQKKQMTLKATSTKGSSKRRKLLHEAVYFDFPCTCKHHHYLRQLI
ncbi:hypothetical protein [Endozoicomonas sp. SCSIO W0465]|uniref:hypothetical protein n=1 Tax=Endozoicomonas sp. SCSIO W0465 TaxID=2918516 RepID=UPI0020751EE4|nr:hypothetical protein [Endozoicomonas sp. SCSIO W0465]USE36638.1 hypothetical protein MJO57_32315 [Endozoicomonas sp. SCSIO W0465]